MKNELDIYLFHRGEHQKAYNYMGAHKYEDGVVFRVWAPHAKEIFVVGDFNGWENKNPMTNINEEGIWEVYIPNIDFGTMYKYRIHNAEDNWVDKSDPYAFYSEMRPNTASIVYNLEDFDWGKDEKKWENKRDRDLTKPINIYEVHLGSWKLDENGHWLNYTEIAKKLVKYVKDLNYTHIEIMPIGEYPLDASWGYQGTGYFSTTSRYGDPKDFMEFMKIMHKNNIGVILDWVPGHFCKDLHGLYKFDGTPTYEYPDTRIGENKEWGTCNFDLTRNEVISFLHSNLDFWLSLFHIDGFRIDAVANMLYLPSGVLNSYGGNDNPGAVEFFKKINTKIHNSYPYALIIGEDSTAWKDVTKSVVEGGLAFDEKWNMGWMNDTLAYFEHDPIYRKDHQEKLTFSFMYAFSENYVLPLSHDEVVHGKKSLLNKMPGDIYTQLSNMRALFAYQILHPGKKLNFMGNEFGQGLEWRFYEQLEWDLLNKKENKKMLEYSKKLNKFYLEEKSLHSDKWDTFEWIDHLDHDGNTIVFMRKTYDMSEYIIGIFNFSGVNKKNYKVGVPEDKKYYIALNSGDEKYGGGGFNKFTFRNRYAPIKESWNNKPQHIEIDIEANSVIFLKPMKSKK